MSKEAHPNIQAVGFTTDILGSIEKWLRGGGKRYSADVMGDKKLNEIIVDFVVDVSTRIDEIVGEKGR